MSKASVPLFRNMLKSVTVETAATIGAQVGVNLLLPDGSVGTVAQLQKLFGSTASSSSIRTTDDVAEGQWNLYFTNRRAQDAVGAILVNSANVTLTYVGGTSITADLTNLADSGAGVLLATTFDAKGRKTGSRAATITGTAGRVTVANGDASAGLPTIDLATVTDAGGGALLRFVRDAWGRLSGTSAATTSDLAEGSNLYFTAARVLATILAGLSTATSAAITAADSVLSAFGKLQAQITTLTASLSGYVPTTRTITAGTGLSGGGDLSANRSLAIANTTVTAAAYGDTTHVATFTVNAQGQLTTAGSSAIAFPVTSVFGRTGAVVAAANDYTFAQLASKPTTLSGYGITDALATITPAGYIDGMKMVWNSATSISVTSGTCYIQASSAVISFPSTLTLSGLSLTASTWYHLYGYLNSGTPAIELVTTAPAAAYSGTARSKTGDTSRRYLGSVVTDSGGNIVEFSHYTQNKILYALGGSGGAPYRVLSAGNATSVTAVSLTGIIPVTSSIAYLGLSTSSTNAYFQVRKSTTAGVFFTQPESPSVLSTPSTILDMPTVSQAMAYNGQSATAAAYIDILGYYYDR